MRTLRSKKLIEPRLYRFWAGGAELVEFIDGAVMFPKPFILPVLQARIN
jgi:hypothetical protein